MGHATTAIPRLLARAILEQRDRVARRLARALDGDVEAVHRARVASRRLREVLAVAVAVGAPPDVARLRRDVRRVTRAFGPVREIDVARESFADAALRHGWSADGVAAVARRLDEERERRRAELATRLHGLDRSWLGARALAATAGLLAVDRPWRQALHAHVATRAAAVAEALGACGTLYSPERLHRVRLAVKKLRYAVELLESSGTPARRVRRALADAQRVLGTLHDLQVLQAEVRSVAAGRRRSVPAPVIRAMADDLERDCRQLHASLLPMLPALTRQVRELGERVDDRRLVMVKAQLAPGRAAGGRRRRPAGA